MSEMYRPDGLNQPSEWELIEAIRAAAAYRRLFVRLADIHADLAWLWVHKTGDAGRPNLRNAGKACGRLMIAAELYQTAGLTRRARSAWRYARLLHRARTKGAA